MTRSANGTRLESRAAMSQEFGLRNADWRFLLPAPPEGVFRRMVLLDAPNGLAQCLRQIGLAEEVLCELPKTRSADAIIVLDGAQVTVADLADRLVPGGVVYVEVDPRSSWSAGSAPARITRALRRGGLTPVGTYLTSRNPARRHVYLPLDSRGALRWFSRTFVVAKTPARRFLAPVLSGWGGIGRLPVLVATPRHVIIAVAGRHGDLPPAPLVHPELPPQLRSTNVCAFLVTPGADDLSRVVMLPFARNGQQPLGVLKLPRRPDGNVLAEQEQEILKTIGSKLDHVMRRTIPTPHGTLRFGPLNVGVESCAAGPALTTALGKWGISLSEKIEHLDRAVAWLAEFHRQTEVTRFRWGGLESGEWLEQPLTTYQSTLGITSDEERLFSAVLGQASRLNGHLVPAVTVHWNFSMSHIFVTDREMTVVDWEGVAPGPPLFDLLFFVMHWAYAAWPLQREDHQLSGFRKLFCEPGNSDPVVTAVHRAITQYMARLDVDRRFYPLLLVMMCVFRALGRANRQEGAVEAGAKARKGNRYVRYIEVLAGQVERLFPEWGDHAPAGGLRASGS